MAQEKIQMPSGTAGLTRYFDDYKSRFELKPGHVVILAVAITLLIVLMHLYGRAWFGF